MSANYRANGQYLYNSSASGIVPPVTLPQASDEVEQLLTKLLYVTANGGSATPSPASGSYTAVPAYYTTTTGAGTLPASLTSFSFYNAGTGIATFGGVAVPGGMTIALDAAPGTKFSQTAYNGNGNNIYLWGASLV